MKVLELKNVKKSYSNFELDINFHLNRGETIGFVGQNGAGKTTTMDIILNTVKKDSGEVLIFGKDHIKNESQVKELMGVVMEEQNFYKDFKINYLLKFASEIYPDWDQNYSEYLRKKLNLIENKKFKELSKGMKVKLALIIALSHNAELLLFDEPTSGLDPKVRNDILEEIEIIKKKNNPAILFSSHNMLDVERLADRIIMINSGKIVFDETKENLLNNWKKIEFQSKNALDFINDNILIHTKSKKDNFYKIIVSNYSQEIENKFNKLNIKNLSVKEMSLEEIFLECLDNKNEGSPSKYMDS